MKLQHLVLAFTAALSHYSEACLEHLKERTDVPPLPRKHHPAPRTKTAITNVRVFDGEHISPPRRVIIDGAFISTDPTNIQTVIDAGGRVLIPGLIDSHVHVSTIQDLEALTSFGVTTAMVMACYNYTTCATLRALDDGLCTFHSAGVPAVAPGSKHSKIVNGSLLLLPTDDPAAVVAHTFNNGSDFFKISMTHAAYIDALQQAALSSTDGIQHIPADGPLPSPLNITFHPHQFLTPTLNIFQYAFSNPAILAFLGRSPTDKTNSYANAVTNLNTLRPHIPILAGTDAFGLLVPGINIPFGLTLHYELQNLVEAGFTPAEALRAATVVAARHHRLLNRGVIAPGKRADLVLLNSDPLVDVRNTLDIARVWEGEGSC
ncbi:hypothetical protein B0T19DRAFT_455847 [Cercophora scortea]|uniref:Amidohydrolase-related domain-containing protein n=1 Tax=Cercophora scortea TaxID=314031 RepID=A0AAE0IUM0_9PEZI|nr:hypothetical protein B0T19DRAFT_455847 [Cercophora scortea]